MRIIVLARVALVSVLATAGAFAVIEVLSSFGETGAVAQDLDMNAIMPCGGAFSTGKLTEDQCKAARDLFLQDCTSCHSFVPVVRLQKDAAGWKATMATMAPKVQGASKADLDSIEQFLVDHFNPGRPVPKLPDALISNDPGFPPA